MFTTNVFSGIVWSLNLKKDKAWILCSKQYKENMTDIKNLKLSFFHKLDKHEVEDGSTCIILSS